MGESISLHGIALSLLLAFFFITFLQSAIDKIIDRKGNLSFLMGHFSKSPLAKAVPFLLTVITIFELSSGLFCIYGLVRIYLFPSFAPALVALTLCGLSLLMLLLGQRLAKDYTGAATLANYFILIMLGFLLAS